MSTAHDERSASESENRKQDRLEFAGYILSSSREGVEIEGLDLADASEALRLLAAARRLQFKRGFTATSLILQTMADADLELTPPAAIEQARRQADHRRRLLATPVYTYETLGELLGHSNLSATRTWVSRKRDSMQLFTVKSDTKLGVVIPAFQLDDEGKPRKDLAPILRILLSAGVDSWALWTWLVGGTPLLSGGVPVELLETDRERTQLAAERFAARHRPVA